MPKLHSFLSCIWQSMFSPLKEYRMWQHFPFCFCGNTDRNAILFCFQKRNSNRWHHIQKRECNCFGICKITILLIYNNDKVNEIAILLLVLPFSQYCLMLCMLRSSCSASEWWTFMAEVSFIMLCTHIFLGSYLNKSAT